MPRFEIWQGQNETAEDEENDDGNAAVNQVAKRRIVKLPVVPVMPWREIIGVVQDNDERRDPAHGIELVKAYWLHATHPREINALVRNLHA
jgi:hypothetical protein